MRSVYHGSEGVSFLGPEIWDMVPDDCKDIDNLNTVRNKVKTRKPENCPVDSEKFTLKYRFCLRKGKKV